MRAVPLSPLPLSHSDPFLCDCDEGGGRRKTRRERGRDVTYGEAEWVSEGIATGGEEGKMEGVYGSSLPNPRSCVEEEKPWNRRERDEWESSVGLGEAGRDSYR